MSFASGAAFNEAGQEQAHMGVAVGDYDRDGRDDLHVTNFENDANILYHNDGNGLFSETTYPAGVGNASVPFVGWGTNFLDYDNDGWLDLFVANGHVYPWVDELDWNTSYEQRPLLFRNLKGRFAEVGRGGGDGLAGAAQRPRLRDVRLRQRRRHGRGRQPDRRPAAAPAQRRRQQGRPLAAAAPRRRPEAEGPARRHGLARLGHRGRPSAAGATSRAAGR